MPTAPTFSILVPTYNQAHFLAESLGSLLAQSDPDWEAVIVDDGSTDATPQELASWSARDPRFRVFRKENGGTASALNRGLEEARGTWILWLSSDDLFEHDRLEVVRNAIRSEPEARFFHGDYGVLDGDTLEWRRNVSDFSQGRAPAPPWQTIAFCGFNYVNGITIAIHRDVFARLGRFDLRYPWGQDFAFWLHASRTERLHFIDRSTVFTRTYATQATTSFPERGIFDSARACADLLNRNRLADLLPDLDWNDPVQACAAIEVCTRILIDGGAILVQAGLGRLLFERLVEAVGAVVAPQAAEELRARLYLMRGQSPAPVVGELWGVLQGAVGSSFAYAPTAPLDEMRRHAARLRDSGADAQAAKFDNYFKWLESKASAGVLGAGFEPAPAF
ncbi:glycosyltransferase family 2 protein [Arenibaculum pallidiluteum]|uniref:glycosyltransferase family 2 protein n=1 Tax=Arenibaculum pallidiluteum TaxID=2812559 RepID=UPI001A96FBCA|nr:glycosyltransferase [Arenibaculum pallidiluteum]